MERENQRVTVTKRMLREGLLRLLEQKDLDKINITELCREAGINRITFYRHYESPHDILMEMEQLLLKEMRSTIKQPHSLSELKGYLETTCTFLDAHLDLITVMIRNNTDNDFYQLFSELFQDIRRDSDLSGILNSIDSDSLDILGMYFTGGAYFILRQWLLGNVKKTPQEMAAISYDLLCNTDWAGIGRQLGLQ